MADLKVSLRRRGSSFALGDRLLPITHWDYVEGKPSTYTPTAHSHNATDINAGTFHVDRIPTLAQSKITNLTTDLAAKALKENSIYYVEGNTSGTNGQWTGSITGLTSYYDGLTIRYRIGISGADPTYLNLNSLGNKQVWRYYNARHTTHWPVGTIVTLTYYAALGYWYNDADYDSTDDYGLRWQNNVTIGAAVHGYQILLEGIDGKFYPVTEGGSSGNTNIVSTAAIKPGGKVVYYSSSGDYAANTNGLAYYIYESHYNGEMEYWNNRDSGWAVAYRPFYFVFTVQIDGSLKLDNSSYTSFMTQDLPTTDDGKIYMQIGIMNNTTDAYRLLIDHPMYQFKDGKLRLYVPDHTHDAAQISNFEEAVEVVSPSGARPASDVSAWAKAATKPTYTYSEVGAAAATHTHDDRYYTETEVDAKTYLKSNTDNRSVITVPNDYNGKFEVKGLKYNSTLGITGGATYSALLGIRGWNDSSGGDSHELAFDGNGDVYHRHGTTTAWSSWVKLYHTGNLDIGVLDGYTQAEVDNLVDAKVPMTRTVNGKALSANISITKSDVGLGSVLNYGIATQAEAEAGSIDTKYMTPLKVKQAIDVLGGGAFEISSKTQIASRTSGGSTAFTGSYKSFMVRIQIEYAGGQIIQDHLLLRTSTTGATNTVTAVAPDFTQMAASMIQAYVTDNTFYIVEAGEMPTSFLSGTVVTTYTLYGLT
jgi:hypothetical protein